MGKSSNRRASVRVTKKHSDSMTTMYGAATALAVAVGIAWMLFSVDPSIHTDIQDPVVVRDIVSYEVLNQPEGETIVLYDYKGDKVPEKLAEDELVTARTETSYTRLISVANKGTKEEVRTYQGVFYPRPTFFKEGTQWYYLEHATTTEENFHQARRQNPLEALFWQKAYAVDIYSQAGDGHASAYVSISGATGECGIQQGWNDAHASAGTSASYTGTTATAYSYRSFSTDTEAGTCLSEGEIYRAFLPIVTSSIPAGATISAATLNIYVATTFDGDNDAQAFMTVVQTDHGGHTTVAAGDYDNCGAITNPTEGIDAAQRKDITSISTVAYTSFTLNATGLGWIKKSGQTSNCSATTGVSCFGIREGHDALDNSPLNTTSTGVSFYNSEQTGTANDPYLAVTYTGGASFAFWQFQDF